MCVINIHINYCSSIIYEQILIKFNFSIKLKFVIQSSIFSEHSYTGPVVENESGKSTPLSDDMAPTPRHMEFMTNAELNLSCCILMLDILLKQVRQEV